MTKIAVLYNDDGKLLTKGSSEDRIAWSGGGRLARAVRQSLERRGFLCEELPCGASITSLADRLKRSAPDLVFNVCESFRGESRQEASVASLLEMLRLPFTGNDPLALALAHDKARCRELLGICGLPVAASRTWPYSGPAPDLDGLRPPLIVKPRHEDGSHGLSAESVCGTTAKAVRRASQTAAQWRQDCLVEEFLPGREFNVGIVLDEAVLPLSEIEYRLPAGLPNLVTYEAKWREDSEYCRGTPVQCPAENVDPSLRTRLLNLALAAWRALGCRDYARVDLRLNAAGDPHILEVNPNPDLSPDAGMARAAEKGGLTYDGLVAGIAEHALRRGLHNTARA